MTTFIAPPEQPLERLSNWEDSWTQFMGPLRKEPFEWGVNDCVLAVGRNVEALTGWDFYSPHVGKYSSAKEAQSYLVANGFSTIVDLVEHYLPEASISHAKRGDVLMFQGSLGIHMGNHAVFFDAAIEQLVKVDWFDATAAWKVG